MTSIQLPSVMDISAVAELKRRLSEFLTATEPVVIDAAEVERVDGSSLQLLLAFQQQANVLGLDLTWQSASEELKASAQLMGLTESLKLA